MIELKNLTFKRDNRIIHNGISCKFDNGKTYAIIGPNGAGKSTLLSLITGQINNYDGEILLKKKNIKKYSKKELAKLISYLPQNELQDLPFSVEEFIKLGSFPNNSDITNLDDIIKKVGLENFRKNRISNLSGGEFKLASLARILMQNTPLILIDELDQGLDIKNKSKTLEIIMDNLKKEKKTIISVVHDINIASLFFDNLLLLAKGGYIVDFGTPQKVINKSNLDNLFMSNIFVEDSIFTNKPMVLGDLKKDKTHKLNSKKIHIICGGGSGSKIMSELFLKGTIITTGVLNIGDSDWKTALTLKLDGVFEEPFNKISKESEEKNYNLMIDSDYIIISGFPIGVGNIKNLEQAVKISNNKKVFLINSKNFSNHTGNSKIDNLIETLRRNSKIINFIDEI